jgi:hypothetical protein
VKRGSVLPFWHYTSGTHVKAILQSGELHPTDVGIDSGERPAVWFSASQTFESTAAKAWEDGTTGSVHIMTMKEMHERVAIARFGIHPESAPVNWETFKRTSGVSRETARRMASLGNPLLWFANYEPVKITDCVAIEMWDGAKWIPIEDRMRQLGMLSDEESTSCPWPCQSSQWCRV